MYCRDSRHKHSTPEKSRKCAMDSWMVRFQREQATHRKGWVVHHHPPREIQRGALSLHVWTEGVRTPYAPRAEESTRP